MQNQRRKMESDLLKRTSKLPQKQLAKKKSLDAQQLNFGLRAVKTDSYTEDHVGRAVARSGQTLVLWL